MKELYTSPEVKLVSFVAEESLTSNEENILDSSGWFGSVAGVNPGDVEFKFEWL